MRPDWDHYFLRIAEAVSERATCHRGHAGGVVVDENNAILITGYNGAAPGEPHCPDDESLAPEDHCPRSLHVENNILAQAARRGTKLEGATWYFWPYGPCQNCQRRYILPTHPRRVVFTRNPNLPFNEEYIDTRALIEAGVEVTVLDLSNRLPA